jgi:hypothetical protein
MSDDNFTTTITVSKTAAQAFEAIMDIHGWWHTGVTGAVGAIGDVFDFYVPGIHHSKIRVEELVPGERIVWKVLETHLTFVDDEREWVGSEIRFDIAASDDGAAITFTHLGLTPAEQCWDRCSAGWNIWARDSLSAFIETGVGNPLGNDSYTTAMTLTATPAEVYSACANVRAWWNASVKGDTTWEGSTFDYEVPGVHTATFFVAAMVPHRRIRWHVMANNFTFIDGTTEWLGTDILFEIFPTSGGTELHFTHVGLTPADECYEVCFDAWGRYIQGSLRGLIETGVGRPDANPDAADLRDRAAIAGA